MHVHIWRNHSDEGMNSTNKERQDTGAVKMKEVAYEIELNLSSQVAAVRASCSLYLPAVLFDVRS